ncbi:MAG: heparinase II/III family protein [Oscillospiraceae bacterium]|nr:heparinase II/III family protein [Oscillospiraceae bacterium]
MKRLICCFLLFGLLASLWAMVATPVKAASDGNTIAASAEELKELFYGRSAGKHPRLYADEDRFTELKKTICKDPYMEKWYNDVYKYYGEQHLTDTLIWVRTAEQQASGGKKFNDLFDGIGRIANAAFLYRLSGEVRFAQCALKDMMMLAAQSNWDYNFLEMAQISYAMGLGYDWLYDYMTADQRSTICNAIYQKAIQAYYTLPSDQIYWKTGSNNLNSWAYGGLTIGALAIFDSYPDACAAFLSEMVTNIQNSMRIYAPCGSYPEGPDYSVSGLSFTVYTLEACNSVLGTDFGLSEIYGFRESGEYLPAINGYTASFNYGDGGVYQHNTATLFWYANRFRKPELALWQRSKQTHDVYTHDAFFALLWYDPQLLEGYSTTQAQKDYLLRDDVNYQSVATFRSDANSQQQIYAAIKSGYIRSSHHTDTDIGTFVMDAMGVRWFCDLGSEDYSILNNSASGYWDWTEGANRWKHYRKRTEGQNTLVINPSTLAGQKTTAKCQISDYGSLEDGGYAVIDMTDAYSTYGATSVKRGLLLFDGRSRVLLRDEIHCNKSSTVYWFAHTQASISISADGKTATLTRSGKTLQAKIASPSNATFTAMAAEPLTPLDPNPNGQKSNAGFRKLAIKLTGVSSVNLSVVFTPIVTQSDASKALPTAGISGFSSLLQSASSADSLPVNGKGEYEISTAQQLLTFSNLVNSGNSFSGKTVRLKKDLDLQGWTFRPIGGCVSDSSGSGKAFSGIFDGENHVIRNLFLYQPKQYYVALFGNVNGATIRNLGIESGRVFGYDKASGLVGLSVNSTIENCYSKANVIGTGPYHGGLVAQVVLTTNVQNSYYNGTVSGTNTTGGLVAYVSSNSTLNLSHCYHVGALTGTAAYTGMIGYYHTSGSMAAKSISVTKCYSTQRLKGSSVAANSQVESYTASGTITSAKMVSAAIYIGGDFMYDCEWENDGYPVLSWQCNTSLPQNGTITKVSELRLLAWQVNSGRSNFAGQTFRLGADLDLASREWIPIGGNTTAPSNSGYAFAGTFDGQGHSIRNLRITSGNCFVALFGRMTGKLCNLGIKSGQVKGYDIAAGLSAYGGTVDRCYNGANVQGHNGVGGVVAMADKHSTTNCYNTGAVTATNLYAGGVVGYYSSGAAGAAMENCYNIGTIQAPTDAGGLVGAVHTSVGSLSIRNCYSLSGKTLVGGNGSQFLSGCALQTAAQLQGAAAKLGTAYCVDTRLRNKGYPTLTDQADDRSAADALFFDFRGDTAAIARYADPAYGGYNYDRGYWGYNPKRSSAPIYGSDTVYFHIAPTTTNYASDGVSPYLQTTDMGNSLANTALNYTPGAQDYVQIRFKMENCAVESGSNPQFRLYYDTTGTGTMAGCANHNIPTSNLNGGAYFVLTQKLHDNAAYTGAKQIESIRMCFLNVHSAVGKSGVISVDYLYIGPESGLPTPRYTVTFKGANGSILGTQLVHKGETADYTGATPTKASDDTYHYTFKGWDKALSNITADTVVTAQFDAAAHSYSYSRIDGANHKAACTCGYSKTAAHTWNKGTITTQPTCTATGIKTFTCTLCNAGKTETVAAKGHTPVVDEAVAATCTAAGKTEGSHCSVCNAVIKAQQTVAALGHSLQYINLDHTEHEVSCTRCAYRLREAHSFTEGSCVCEEPEFLAPVQDSSLRIYHSLNLASDISVNYILYASALEGYQMDTVYLECRYREYEGNTEAEEVNVRLRPELRDGKYYFTLHGLTAVHMNTSLQAVLYGSKDRQPYYSAADEYSIGAYAYAQMEKEGATETLKTLCADLLRYGGAAQSFKGYRTDALVDAAMTETQRSYLSDLEAVSFGDQNTQGDELSAPAIQWMGKALDLNTKVAVLYVIDARDYSGFVEALSIRVRYTDLFGKETEAVLTEAEPYGDLAGRYCYRFEGLTAAELRTVLTAVVYEGNQPVSNSLTYSPDTYGRGKTGTLGHLCSCLFAYSDSAKQYFMS